MTNKPKQSSNSEKFHKRNIHRFGYDFSKLTEASPELKDFLVKLPGNRLSINFSDPQAVVALNKALLKYHYKLEFWDLPKGYLCPPIPGRADYLYYVSDLLDEKTIEGESRKKVKGLDIGAGASLIYPILGNKLFDWNFVASETNVKALKAAQAIVKSNKGLRNKIQLRRQNDLNHVFKGIIGPEDRFDFTICNPPFYKSEKEAKEANMRKASNLSKGKLSANYNFGGGDHELWCKGGELAFIQKMIEESAEFAQQCKWFTSLVSQKENVKKLEHILKWNKVKSYRFVEMKQGQKVSRFVAWTFM
ncbi:23S rRNA (adenine(1618)-N(6))-methyltransferase RlmF [Aureibacter tunicatorum]|uniref:Ribosomal RNA large subunit methyltransferase F n=1 Tax=Aureibacter tunicatorum TaxID=866807 RepID=A0AAE3XSA4_9BACT|nr:23S rRNA (adenine(1618)-N(6))-methyltransferase RlmF [Aureibacter tunicatorum]MDR6241065.1 23S rRNA (adenine1618-N6)-methyltransferase [Aureibacter tunicatorum]BDD03843.1 ribosomal RNA large subunit methyltransferase F [Aureibacter tunicatorum]